METRLPSTANVTATASAPRLTPTQPKVPFAQVLGQTAALGAEAAMTVLPGGPMMAAALRGSGASGAMQTMSQSLSPGGLPAPSQKIEAASLGALGVTPTTSASGAAPAAAAAEGPGAVAPAGGLGGAGGIDGALAQSQDMNLYYLRIQEQVNAENRSFTTYSNVMKAEHETVKTAIGNIR